MALSGNYIKVNYTPSETEFETVTITYPESLPETDPNYELRGTTVEEEVAVMVKSEEILENKYVIITGLTIEKVNVDSNNINYSYRVFNSQEDRINIDSHILDGGHFFTWDDNSEVNPFVRCYNHLKTMEECVNLINS